MPCRISTRGHPPKTVIGEAHCCLAVGVGDFGKVTKAIVLVVAGLIQCVFDLRYLTPNVVAVSRRLASCILVSQRQVMTVVGIFSHCRIAAGGCFLRHSNDINLIGCVVNLRITT